MATGFIKKLPGGIEVLKRAADKQWGDVDMNSPPKGCGHTTETTSLPSYGPGQAGRADVHDRPGARVAAPRARKIVRHVAEGPRRYPGNEPVYPDPV